MNEKNNNKSNSMKTRKDTRSDSFFFWLFYFFLSQSRKKKRTIYVQRHIVFIFRKFVLIIPDLSSIKQVVGGGMGYA